ncbi:MAG TPA: primosomal protein N' [bacterium]|nr:primosomal protein N' [bacterium]
MEAASHYVSVWLPVPRRLAFTYAVPADWPALRPGSLVVAPLGRRQSVGIVAATRVQPDPDLAEIKPLSARLPEIWDLSPPLLRVLQWSIGHYLAPPGEALRAFLPPALLKTKSPDPAKARLRPIPALETLSLPEPNAEQNAAIEAILAGPEGFQAYLLHGITGSGKTEVYLRLCAELLGRGRSALILVPEIALTPQTVGRFAARFGAVVGSYHSAMTEAQRLKTWIQARSGELRILVGTRSALALPLQDLGLVVVDEEHDSSYKQEERFRYQGRDLAVLRAREEGIPVVLGSATPSLESLENAESGKYRLLHLPDRATRGALPKIHLVDLKKEAADPETLLSPSLAAALAATLARGEQALLFLNRRGFAPFLLCRGCGEAPNCPNCEIALTYHKRPAAMVCHYCEFRAPPPERCPRCSDEELQAMGSGTERLEEALARLHPGRRIARLDRDVSLSRQRTEEILTSFAKGEIDILVGTQLVAKGHDFKQLTLVGILLADSTLHQPDFRSAERLFQLVTQVAGRAGRHDLPGEVFLQTFRPEHYAIAAALEQDPHRFFLHEREHRREAEYPPFRRLVLLRLSGNQAGKVEQAARKLAEDLRTLFARHPEVKVLGPSKSALEKLRGKYRWQLLLRTSKYEAMRRVLEEKLGRLEKSLAAGVSLHVDVDPAGSF